MRRGDILVARITTPAWTPLFALAAGVVTDVGGPLSHSSIVAREYHIPAVLGTGTATDRLRSGERITVDGDGGTVTVLDGTQAAQPAPQPAAKAHSRLRAKNIALVGLAAVGLFAIAAWWRKWRRS
jgi:pyruvate,water dikinase